MRIARNYFEGMVAMILIILIMAWSGCDKNNDDRLPLAPVDITISPNSTIYQELNIVGGWLYLDEYDGVYPPSRGIIVYRLSTDQFLAFERTPPYKPDSCCNASKTICAKLIVENYFPFIMDTCSWSKYLILDGSPVEGPSKTPLGQYYTAYKNQLLHIHN
ncbi:MAG: hypothetical protein K0B08_07540 [Bacteroidales bacterium]|nr:hypothetical protein [Bacteroidales bacterium]